jgi:hypothetical protein
MHLFSKTLPFFVLWFLGMASTGNAAPQCPIQGLEPKICPIVVTFFDDVAKQNPEFAKHWQNHHWVGQNFDPSSIKDLELTVTTHAKLFFRTENSKKGLVSFVDDSLRKAAVKNPGFQQVIDSHNFFLMTVEALTERAYSAADRFNPLNELAYFELGSKQEYQAPVHNAYLNKAGIFTTTAYQYVHATKVYASDFGTGQSVNPVVVTPLTAITPSSKHSRTTPATQGKIIAGGTGGVRPASSAATQKPVNTIQKSQTASRVRQGTPAGSTTTVAPASVAPATVTPATVGNKTRVSGLQKKIYLVTIPSKTSSGSSGNKQVGHSPNQIQKNQKSGSRDRQGQPQQIQKSQTASRIRQGSSAVSTTTVAAPAGHSKKKASGQQKKIAGRGSVGATFPPNSKTNSKNSTRPEKVVIQKTTAGVTKKNVNSVLTTSTAGSQTSANERTYLIDGSGQVWSCKVSGLGWRITSSGNGAIRSHGHVETTHVRSAQLAHIPANHAGSSGCLISVSK